MAVAGRFHVSMVRPVREEEGMRDGARAGKVVYDGGNGTIGTSER